MGNVTTIVGRSYIIHSCAGLSVDGEMRILCPFCEGGQSKEVSMSARRIEPGILYICHRATCQRQGFIPTNGILLQSKPKPDGAKSKIRHFSHETVALTGEDYDRFYEKFQLSRETINYAGIKYCPALWRFVFPIFDYFGRTVGVVARSYCGGKPKSLNFPFSETPITCWYDQDKRLGKKTIPMVLAVEDQVSALKVNQITGMPTIALLGTNLSLETARSIAFVARKLVLWLDYDAIRTAQRLSDKFALTFTEGVRIVATQTDPKDTPQEQVLEVINSLSK